MKNKSAREIIEEQPTIETTATPVEEVKTEATASQPAEEAPVKNEVVLGYNEKGVAKFEDHNQLSQVAALYMQTKLAPDHLIKEGKGAVMSAIAMCRQYQIPDTCMNEMCYIKGKLTTYGKLVTALAERHPEYGDRRDFFITKEGDEICTKNKNIATGKPYCAVIQIKKKGSEVWNEYTFSIDDAIKAKLLNDKEVSTKEKWQEATWTKYVKDMMWNKANARALGANYASALKGVNYHEDLKEVFENIRDVSPKSNSNLKDTFNEESMN